MPGQAITPEDIRADYYELLGIGPDADAAAIRSAYREKMSHAHPDRGGSHAAAIQLNRAGEILLDPELRRDYDFVRDTSRTTRRAHRRDSDNVHAQSDSRRSQKDAPPSASELHGLSEEERAAVVEEWRRNHADLNEKPTEGRESDRHLPFGNKVLGGGLAAVVFIAGFILTQTILYSSQEMEEVAATVIAAAKPDADGVTTVLVDIPGEEPKQVYYRGTKQLSPGQRVVLEATVRRFLALEGRGFWFGGNGYEMVVWKTYRFKNPREGGS